MSLDPRRCLHSLTTFERGDEVQEAQIVSGKFVVTGCNTPEVFDFAEETFNHVALFVEFSVERPPLCCCGSTGYDRFCSGRGDSVHSALTVITFVRQHIICLETLKKTFGLGDFVTLASRQDEAYWIAQGIGSGMDLGTQSSFGPSQCVSFKPIFGLIAFFGHLRCAGEHVQWC